MASIVYSVMQKPLVERLEDAACIYWDVNADFFRDKKKKDEVSTNRRHLLFYLLKNDGGLGDTTIANKYGYSQSSITEALQIIEFRKSNSRLIADDMKQIQQIAAKLEARIIVVPVILEQFMPNQHTEREQ